jgi:hypothetical protein
VLLRRAFVLCFRTQRRIADHLVDRCVGRIQTALVYEVSDAALVACLRQLVGIACASYTGFDLRLFLLFQFVWLHLYHAPTSAAFAIERHIQARTNRPLRLATTAPFCAYVGEINGDLQTCAARSNL